jgi:ribosome-associated translation inhibitor RaiA
MHIQVTTDNHVASNEGLTRHIETVVGDAMKRFGARVIRVEVHLGDHNSHKGGGQWCNIEARLAGLQPLAAKAEAPSLNQAIDSATAKLLKVLDHTIGRKEDPRGRTGSPKEIGPEISPSPEGMS